MHISPLTVEHLRGQGHDVLRVSDVLPSNSTDALIIDKAVEQRRVILTQDLDFSAEIAIAGRNTPSLISLRLSSARIDYVNSVLDRILSMVEEEVGLGAIVVVEDRRVRIRRLPIA